MSTQANHYLSYLGSNIASGPRPRRVLRESSPNVRVSRNALRSGPGHQSQHRIYKSQARATIKQPYHLSRTSETLGGSEEIVRLEIDTEAEFQWVWARAWQCERYRNYRSKKHDSKSGESEGRGRQKDFDWPDHYEKAFWKAIVMYRPRERERLKSAREPNKELGRNESIAEYLELKFGKDIWPPKKKGRKVVSSHIQVLRGHLSLPKPERDLIPPPPNPFGDVLAYFPREETKKEKERKRASDSQLSIRTAIPYYKNFPQFPRPQDPPVYNFKPSHFQMYIRYQQGQRIYITKLRDNAEPVKVSVTDVQDQISHFPELRSLLSGGTLCHPVVLAEASFCLPNLEQFTAEKSLCIEQCVTTSRRLAADRVWSTRTRIVENLEEFVFREKLEPPKDAPENTYDIKFRSAYWVGLLTRYDALRRAQSEREYITGVPEVSEVARIADHLRSIRAVQEILSTPALGDGHFGEPERHMIICWTFRQAQHGEPGMTQWQELVIPPTLPTMSNDYPSPDASFRADSEYDEKLHASFDLYNNTPLAPGLDFHQANAFAGDDWTSPTRIKTMPYYGATTWPVVDHSQTMIPRSYEIPSFDVTTQPTAQEFYGAPEYLAVNSFGMTPPNSTVVANFPQSFDSATTSGGILTPDSGEESQGVEYSQGDEYSQGAGYSHASIPQFVDHTVDHNGMQSQSAHIYAPQAQYTHLPLNTSFMYDQTLQDFSSFNRVIEDDQTVGGLEYNFEDQAVPILPSQPVSAAERHRGDNDASLSHLRLTAAFDPHFFAECQAGMLDIPQLLPSDLDDGVMSHSTANAAEQAHEHASLLQHLDS